MAFEDDATRIAIQVLVQLNNENKWAGTGFLVQASRELEEGPKISCLLVSVQGGSLHFSVA